MLFDVYKLGDQYMRQVEADSVLDARNVVGFLPFYSYIFSIGGMYDLRSSSYF